MGICELQYSAKVKIRLRELAPAARGSRDAGSRNLVFTFQLSTVGPESEIDAVCGHGRGVVETQTNDGLPSSLIHKVIYCSTDSWSHWRSKLQGFCLSKLLDKRHTDMS